MGKPLRDSRERKSVLYRLIQYSGGDIRLMAAILDKAVENKWASLLPLYSSPARTVKLTSKPSPAGTTESPS